MSKLKRLQPRQISRNPLQAQSCRTSTGKLTLSLLPNHQRRWPSRKLKTRRYRASREEEVKKEAASVIPVIPQANEMEEWTWLISFQTAAFMFGPIAEVHFPLVEPGMGTVCVCSVNVAVRVGIDWKLICLPCKENCCVICHTLYFFMQRVHMPLHLKPCCARNKFVGVC